MKTWEDYAEQIHTLRGNLGFPNDALQFLGYIVDLDNGNIYDNLKERPVNRPITLYILLAHYSRTQIVQRADTLIKYRELPGGYAYEGAFIRKAVTPIAEVFGENPEMLVKSAERLNGIRLEYGDSSVEIPSLPKIPLTYIIWQKTSEFPPSATVLFDRSASLYLHTEDLAVLAEITTNRLFSSLKQITSGTS
ncbi:MAG: DUF3786 domain-containing protein [Candidatus Hodarchaeota archaeon]